ncbi:hypothetical protein J6590_015850 [Homalodisca vitripennis]|nr:hypothetical protein J6590_015850 [Homalodisca vitripennis]
MCNLPRDCQFSQAVLMSCVHGTAFTKLVLFCQNKKARKVISQEVRLCSRRCALAARLID